MIPPRVAYFSNASLWPRVAPGDLPASIGVTAAPGERRLIGIAFENGWVAPAGSGPAETLWRLVVQGKLLEGKYVLRHGAFVELAEEA